MEDLRTLENQLVDHHIRKTLPWFARARLTGIDLITTQLNHKEPTSAMQWEMPIAVWSRWASRTLLLLHGTCMATILSNGVHRQKLMVSLHHTPITLRFPRPAVIIRAIMDRSMVQLTVTLWPITVVRRSLLIWTVAYCLHLPLLVTVSHQLHSQWWDSLAPKSHRVHKRNTNAKCVKSASHDQALYKHTCTVTLARSVCSFKFLIIEWWAKLTCHSIHLWCRRMWATFFRCQ